MCVAAPPITPLFTAPPCHAPTPAAPPPPRPPVYGENKRRVSNLVMGVCDALSVGARRRRAKALQYLKVLKISILCIHIFPYLTPDFQYTTLILDPQVNRPLRVGVRQLPRAPSEFCVCSHAASRCEHLQTCPMPAKDTCTVNNSMSTINNSINQGREGSPRGPGQHETGTRALCIGEDQDSTR